MIPCDVLAWASSVRVPDGVHRGQALGHVAAVDAFWIRARARRPRSSWNATVRAAVLVTAVELELATASARDLGSALHQLAVAAAIAACTEERGAA
jgi:hypothetical protein